MVCFRILTPRQSLVHRPISVDPASMPTRRVCLGQLISAAVAARATSVAQRDAPQEISGVNPTLAMFSNERECGTGAVHQEL